MSNAQIDKEGVWEELSKANALIAELEGNHNRAKEMVLQDLATIFAGIILFYPMAAHEQDVLSRLWEVCFDNEIKIYCVRIRNAKAKRNNDPEIRKFAKFLDDAIKYYGYLDEHFKQTIAIHPAENNGEVNEGVRQCSQEVNMYLAKLYSLLNTLNNNQTPEEKCFDW